ncbi:MAG: hypothetical protein ACI4JQ_03060 [Ruminococcus sp.]
MEKKDEFKIERKYEMETKTFRIPVPMAEQLEKLAQEYNVSVNGLIIQCIRFALDHLN